MKRTAMILGFGLVCALAGCGGNDPGQKAAQQANESTQVTVESATRDGVPSTEHTEVTVDSADERKPAKE